MVFKCFLVYINKKNKNLQFFAFLFDSGITSKGKSDTLVFLNLFLPNLLCISKKSGLLKKGNFSYMYQLNFSK